MNEKDKQTAQGVAYKYLDDTDSSRRLQSDITAALTTARKEARAKGRLEGLREADQIGFVVGAVRERIQILESEQRRAIEAAANVEEGGGDG